MKYIRHKKYGILLFPNTITHKFMAECLIKMDISYGEEDEIVSAGFVRIDLDGNPDCYGTSASLEKSSLEEDSEILRKRFNK